MTPTHRGCPLLKILLEWLFVLAFRQARFYTGQNVSGERTFSGVRWILGMFVGIILNLFIIFCFILIIFTYAFMHLYFYRGKRTKGNRNSEIQKNFVQFYDKVALFLCFHNDIKSIPQSWYFTFSRPIIFTFMKRISVSSWMLPN